MGGGNYAPHAAPYKIWPQQPLNRCPYVSSLFYKIARKEYKDSNREIYQLPCGYEAICIRGKWYMNGKNRQYCYTLYSIPLVFSYHV